MDDAFGARADERFEDRQKAFLSFRAYLATLKRLRAEYYLREDPGTTLSDRSFAQRMLSRANIGKPHQKTLFLAKYRVSRLWIGLRPS